MNITSSSVQSYGNTRGELPDFREHTTTGDKYWQETNRTEMHVNAAGLHCHKAGMIQDIQASAFI